MSDTDLPLALLADLRILLVDSSSAEAAMYAFAFDRMGARASTAESVNDGLAAAAHERFIVVIVDVRFPETRGYDLARALRAAGSHVVMIALGDIAEPEQEDRSLAAGFDAYCPRPCTPNQLATHVVEILLRSERA